MSKAVPDVQSSKGHHISKSKSRVQGALLASRGIVAAYPKAVRLSHLMTHAKHYLVHDTLLIRWEIYSPHATHGQRSCYSTTAALVGALTYLQTLLVL